MTVRIGPDAKTFLNRFIDVNTKVAGVIGLLVVAPIAFYTAWRGLFDRANTLLTVLFVFSFAWALISLLRYNRQVRKAGFDPEALRDVLSGPKPQEAEELMVWRMAWHYMLAGIAVMLCIFGMMLLNVFFR